MELKRWPALRGERAVDAVAVQDVRRQVVDENVPDVAGLVERRVERDLGDRLLLALLEQHQMDAVGVPGEDGEVDAAGPRRGAERPAVAAGGRERGARWRGPGASPDGSLAGPVA